MLWCGYLRVSSSIPPPPVFLCLLFNYVIVRLVYIVVNFTVFRLVCFGWSPPPPS